MAVSGRVIRAAKLKTGKFETAIRVVDIPSQDQHLLTEFIRSIESGSQAPPKKLETAVAKQK